MWAAAHSSNEYMPLKCDISVRSILIGPMMTYHHVLDSALSTAALFLVVGGGCRLIPIASAVRTARPTWKYDPFQILVHGIPLILHKGDLQ